MLINKILIFVLCIVFFVLNIKQITYMKNVKSDFVEWVTLALCIFAFIMSVSLFFDL